MGLLKRFFNMTGKPEGFLGKLMLKGMNFGHAKVAQWGMDQFPETQPRKMADLGCGGGRNAAALLEKYPQAQLTAIDLSPLSVEATKRTNARAVQDGRCLVLEGNAAKLPFSEDSLDLVTAFETIYFWPGLPACFAEVHRALKKGAYFIVVNESDGRDKQARKYEKMIDGMKAYTIPEIREALQEAGFEDVRYIHHHQYAWIMMIARK